MLVIWCYLFPDCYSTLCGLNVVGLRCEPLCWRFVLDVVTFGVFRCWFTSRLVGDLLLVILWFYVFSVGG